MYRDLVRLLWSQMIGQTLSAGHKLFSLKSITPLMIQK
jgi:hypothetical protein